MSGTVAAGYNTDFAVKIMEGIAGGMTIGEILKQEGMPSRATFYRWLVVYPELNKSYEAARELSAQSFEEEALDMARTLKGTNDFSGTKVRMYEVAMAQLRWSAARRDPKRYGAKQEASLVVPIQINTTLDMGNGAKTLEGTTISPDNIYHIEAVMGDPAEDTDTLLDTALDVPEPKPKKNGQTVGSTRQKMKHKTPAQLRATLAAKGISSKRKPKDVLGDAGPKGSGPVGSGSE
jgi:hypothetical protein